MPYAVTHFLVAAILIALFRDYYLRKRDRKKFPLHYVLIGGLAGLLPDLDYVIYYGLNFFGFAVERVYRNFTHNLFVPLGFLLLAFIFIGTKNKELGKHKLKLSTIFFVVSFAVFIHLVLDAIIGGMIVPFYGLSDFAVGLNLINIFPEQIRVSSEAVLDAVLLVFWMIYIEVRHKISDFI